jgi:hypothetical protein
MMHMTRLVRMFAKLPDVPAPGACPVPNIRNEAADTLEADLGLVRLCSQQALAAADRCGHVAISRFCAETAQFYQALSHWRPQEPHPATDTNPAVFHSFGATLDKFDI